jgi:hypothetical protein
LPAFDHVGHSITPATMLAGVIHVKTVLAVNAVMNDM